MTAMACHPVLPALASSNAPDRQDRGRRTMWTPSTTSCPRCCRAAGVESLLHLMDGHLGREHLDAARLHRGDRRLPWIGLCGIRFHTRVWLVVVLPASGQERVDSATRDVSDRHDSLRVD